MRLDRLVKKLEASPESNLRAILAWGMFEWGVSRSVMRDYLSVLQDTGLISISLDVTIDGPEDGIIFWEGSK